MGEIPKAPDCRYGLVQAASDRHGSCQCLSKVESSSFRAKVFITGVRTLALGEIALHDV